MKKGLLLINLGTPKNLSTFQIMRYLFTFLRDKRVIDLPFYLRYPLICLIVLFRSKRTQHAYQSIWTDKGSPLLTHSLALKTKLQDTLAKTHIVTLGMRYGNPSIYKALAPLQSCQEITIIPLYPQYASSSSGSAIEAALNIIKKWDVMPTIHIVRDFYDNPAHIKAWVDRIKPYLTSDCFTLFSYHGLPERHLQKTTCSEVCSSPCFEKQSNPPKACYRAQCYATTKAIADQLGLPTEQYITTFQSRLGRTPWIKPYTDEVFIALREKGIQDICVVCPSFIVDCLETLEEIGIQGREQWEALGGRNFTLIPCLNEDFLDFDKIL